MIEGGNPAFINNQEPKQPDMPSPQVLSESSSIYRLLVQRKPVGTAFAVPTDNPKLTGFSVLVTAAHALAGVLNDSSSEISLDGIGKKPIPVVRHFLSKDFDAAVLIFKAPLPVLPVGDRTSIAASCQSENYSFFPAMTTHPRILAKGYVVEVGTDEIWAFLMPFDQGGSGAPLVVDGRAVGLINQRVLDENKYPTGIVHAIDIQKIMHFINTLK
jgi:hypothetical protein